MSKIKEIVYLVLIVLLLGLCGQLYYSYKYIPAHERDVHVYYNQEQALNTQIVDIIQNADKFVYFAIYTFTRNDIKDALLAAKYRGLKLVGITDKDQYTQISSQKQIVDELRKADIPVYEQNHLGIMHMKTVVTEKSYASGSYNWTAAATNLNDEVLEVGNEESIRTQYQHVLEALFKNNHPQN